MSCPKDMGAVLCFLIFSSFYWDQRSNRALHFSSSIFSAIHYTCVDLISNNSVRMYAFIYFSTVKEELFIFNKDNKQKYNYVVIHNTCMHAQFDELLGKGAMKSVYRGFDEERGVEVAWNQASLADVLRSPDAVQRMYSEVQLLSELRHDGIIGIMIFKRRS